MKPVSIFGVRSVIKKEFRQIRRDSRTLAFMFFLPAFLLLMFGFALNLDVKHIPLAVVDEDGSRTSRDLVDKFRPSEYFDLTAVLSRVREIDPLMAKATISVAIVIPPKFAEDLLGGRSPSVQILVDGSNSTSGTTATGYVAAILQTYSENITLEALERQGGGSITVPLAAEIRVWYNPELRSSKFLIPGLIAFILMVIVTISTAASVVREKERGTMDQLQISSLRSMELIIGKMIPYALISLVAAHLVLLFSQALFGVGIQGNYPLLLTAMFLFVLGGLGQGLLISSFTRTQQVAFLLALLTTMLPTFILSGFVFPIRNMPVVVQAITYFVPGRYFLSALRAIILKRAGLATIWTELMFLAAFAASVLGASAARLGRGEKDPHMQRRGRART